MATPRFLLVHGGPGDHLEAASWPGSAHAPIEIDLRVPARPWTSWRLLGRNNRELGRSPRRFDLMAECLADVAETHQLIEAGGFEPSIVRSPLGGWTWRWGMAAGTSSGDAPRALAARSYPRRRDAEASAAQFLSDGTVAGTPADGGEPVVVHRPRPLAVTKVLR